MEFRYDLTLKVFGEADDIRTAEPLAHYEIDNVAYSVPLSPHMTLTVGDSENRQDFRIDDVKVRVGSNNFSRRPEVIAHARCDPSDRGRSALAKIVSAIGKEEGSRVVKEQ